VSSVHRVVGKLDHRKEQVMKLRVGDDVPDVALRLDGTRLDCRRS